MKLELIKFGDFLSSRPAGREAWLATKAYILDKIKTDEIIEVDFSGIKVLTPSWADEFLAALAREFPGQVVLLPSDNASVKASLEFVKI
jgi:hypothetical protein